MWDKLNTFIFNSWRKSVLLELRKQSIKEREEEIENEVNQRVAEIISKQDPLAPLLKNFNGIFSDDKERPEDGLGEQNVIQLEMFGHRNHTDQHFHFLMDWITNTMISATLKKPMGTPEQIVQSHMYSRALIAVTGLMRKEIGRLSLNYERRQQRGEPFDPHSAV